MSMTKRRLSLKSLICIALALIFILSLTGCGTATTSNVRSYRMPNNMESIATQVIDENDSFSLEWNEELACAFIRNKQSGKIWSAPPYDIWEEGGSSSISSAIYIEYYDTVTGVLEEARSSDCVDEGTVSVTVKDKLLREEIYFSYAGIMIPIEYSLNASGMHIEIKASEIREKSSVKLISISVLPYMVSTINTTAKDSYLVIPSGSGAISYPVPDLQNGARSLELAVYGTDPVQQRVEYKVEDVKVNLPVFAVKAKNDGLLGVISSGAESAELHIESGNIRTEHSTVYPKFTVHGYDRFEVQMQNYEDENVYNDKISLSQIYAVDYYPLCNNEATYSGMATKYRENILKLDNNKANNSIYHISFIGGTMIKSFVLGIPTQKFNSLTSFDDAKEILTELYDATKVIPNASLYGFGKTGVDIGEIGGGFNFASQLGGKKGAEELEKFCEEKEIGLYTDFNVTAFSKSGSGFSTLTDVARTASLQYSYYYPLYKNIPMQNMSLAKIRCLKREKLTDAVDKLLNFANKRVSGISFSDLGHIAYSDYRNEDYFVRNNLPNQVSSLLETVKKAGHSLSLKGANAYAAIYADSLTDTPLDNGGYGIFDESIPFYQMVFRGSSALYSKAVNLSSNTTNAILNAVEYGVYPSFTLSAEFDKKLIDSYSDEIFSSAYTETSKKLICDTVKKTAKLYNAIGNSEIISHIKNGTISTTEYANGIVIYVNYGNKTVDVSGVTVNAGDFAFTERSVSR